MFGDIPPSIAAEAILIMAWRALVFVAPVLAAGAFWWLVNRTDRALEWVFPHLEWERDLGWLNIRAERRAKTALRYLGYTIYLMLAAMLLGIVWSARGVDELPAWSDPMAIGDVMLRVAVLTVCVGAWTLFLGGWLIPKMRQERQDAELRRFRASLRDDEEDRRWHSRTGPSRIKAPLVQPRTDKPLEPVFLDRRGRLRPPPGG